MASELFVLFSIAARVVQLLLPALIPSWRFFKTVAPSPRVEVLIDGEWRENDPRPERVSFAMQTRRLFWNPDWNDYLYTVSLSERQAFEPTEYSYAELTKRISDRLPLGVAQFQYRLIFVSREGDEIVRHVEFESPVVTLEKAA